MSHAARIPPLHDTLPQLQRSVTAMGISRAAYVVPAPGFIIRHVSFLDLDLELKSATLDWLEFPKDGSADVLAEASICGPRCFLFAEDDGELVNAEALEGAFENSYCRIEIAKKINASLDVVDRPMALRFSVIEDADGGLQFIALPLEVEGRRLRLLRIAGW